MNVHSEYVEATTTLLSFDNMSFCKAEDSGYHTFTPGSIECSETSSEYLEHSIVASKTCITGQIQLDYYSVTPDVNINLKYSHSTKCTDSSADTPIRRGVKRPYSQNTHTEKTEITSSVPTPTSLIAGKIQNLKVNENKENTHLSLSPLNYKYAENASRYLYQLNDPILSYPTTPVKKNCKLNPCHRSAKKLNFTIHSLSCETSGLQPVHKQGAKSNTFRTTTFRPDKKIDIIQMLYKEACAMPPISKIISYLSNEDIYNFSLVSKEWLSIWQSVSENNKKKLKYVEYLKTAKENQENRDKGVTPKINNTKQMRCLREIHNEMNDNTVNYSLNSPPGTPRTNRFRKFTKSASLDSRTQLSCVRCCQPAKVTEETSGEIWVECTSTLCSFQFCKYCKCERHPGKFCFRYDLNGPSPTKRKRNCDAVGTKKSRKNLRRLL